MERKTYIELCQRASFKSYYSGAWWRTKWNPEELVSWKGDFFVPVDYRFGFVKGKPRHLAILHDLEANTEYTVLLEEVDHVQNLKNKEAHPQLPDPPEVLRGRKAGADREGSDAPGV